MANKKFVVIMGLPGTSIYSCADKIKESNEDAYICNHDEITDVDKLKEIITNNVITIMCSHDLTDFGSRKILLESTKDIECDKYLYLVYAPVGVIYNSPGNYVTNELLEKYFHFDIPSKSEGWDSIRIWKDYSEKDRVEFNETLTPDSEITINLLDEFDISDPKKYDKNKYHPDMDMTMSLDKYKISLLFIFNSEVAYNQSFYYEVVYDFVDKGDMNVYSSHGSKFAISDILKLFMCSYPHLLSLDENLVKDKSILYTTSGYDCIEYLIYKSNPSLGYSRESNIVTFDDDKIDNYEFKHPLSVARIIQAMKDIIDWKYTYMKDSLDDVLGFVPTIITNESSLAYEYRLYRSTVATIQDIIKNTVIRYNEYKYRLSTNNNSN